LKGGGLRANQGELSTAKKLRKIKGERERGERGVGSMRWGEKQKKGKSFTALKMITVTITEKNENEKEQQLRSRDDCNVDSA